MLTDKTRIANEAALQRLENAKSINSVPRSLLDEKRRHTYIHRALDGEDVYAYTAVGGESWYLWNVNERIPLGEVAK